MSYVKKKTAQETYTVESQWWEKHVIQSITFQRKYIYKNK